MERRAVAQIAVDDGAAFVRVAATPTGAAVRDVRAFRDGAGGATAYYDAGGLATRSERLRFLLAAHDGDARAAAAAVVLLGLDGDRGRPAPPGDGAPHAARPRDPDGDPEPWLAAAEQAARYCGYKHREKRRVALLASHLECGAQLATEAKLQRHLAAKRAARLRNKELRARGLPEDADDDDRAALSSDRC